MMNIRNLDQLTNVVTKLAIEKIEEQERRINFYESLFDAIEATTIGNRGDLNLWLRVRDLSQSYKEYPCKPDWMKSPQRRSQ